MNARNNWSLSSHCTIKLCRGPSVTATTLVVPNTSGPSAWAVHSARAGQTEPYMQINATTARPADVSFLGTPGSTLSCQLQGLTLIAGPPVISRAPPYRLTTTSSGGTMQPIVASRFRFARFRADIRSSARRLSACAGHLTAGQYRKPSLHRICRPVQTRASMHSFRRHRKPHRRLREALVASPQRAARRQTHRCQKMRIDIPDTQPKQPLPLDQRSNLVGFRNNRARQIAHFHQPFRPIANAASATSPIRNGCITMR